MKAWAYLLLFTALGASAGSIEAEAGRIAPGKAKIEPCGGASGGRIVRLVGTPAMKPEEADRELSLTLPFTTERNGDFELVAYVCTENGADDSAFFRVDEGKLRLFSAGHPKKAAPVTLGTFKLAAGKHTLDFHRREPGFGIDRLEVRPIVVPPRLFEVPGKTGVVQSYEIEAVPGNYVMRILCRRDREGGPQRNARITIGERMPIVRRIIKPTRKHGAIYMIERVAFRGKPVRITLEIDPEVTIDKLVFQPVRKKLPPAAAAYVPKIVPRPDRPRLLVNRETLPVILDRMKRGANARAWAEVQQIARKPFVFKVLPGKEVQWDGALVKALRCKAFYYLATGDEKVAREACELAVAYFKVVNFGNEQDVTRPTGEAIQAASIVYDWCCPVMTDAERAVLRDRFLWQAESMEIGWPPFLQTITFGHGNERQLNRDLLSMAIAVYNEDPVPWKYCTYCLLEQARPMKRHLYKSGYHYEGSAYGTVRYHADISAAFLLKRACDFDQYEPYVGKVPFAWSHLRLPDGKLFFDGDNYMRGAYPGNEEIFLWANALWPDGKLLGEYLRFFRNRARPFTDPVFYLLTADPDQTPDFRRDDLPLVRYFGEPLSLLVARTGWNMGYAAEDVLVELTGAGIANHSHQHFDAGQFQLFYRGPLTCDIGQYRFSTTAYALDFGQSTMSHSCLRLVDPQQKKTRMRDVRITSGIQEDAGRPPLFLEDVTRDREKYSRGDVLSVSADPLTPHLQADLAKSYPGRAKHCRRTMVFLAAKHPALVVYDEIELARPEITPVWQITTFARPREQNGQLIADSRHYGLPARLTVSTLLPRRAVKRILTGKDAHTVEGVFYPPPFPDGPEAAASRTEITALPGETATRFLHVLQPTPGTDAEPVAMTEKDGVVTLASKGWTLVLAPGKAPKAVVTDPAKPAPPPRDTLYLDGKPVGKLVDGKISLAALLRVRGTAFTEKDGVLAFDDLTLRDGEKSPLTGGAVVESGGGQWLVPAETAAGLVNAAVARDRWSGSLFLTSRGRPAKTLWTTAAGGSAADWRELVENGTYRFEANGVFVGTAGFRRAEVMDGVRIRFRQGDVRRARFRIDVSPDGKTFAAVFDGMSSGKADGFETFAFPAQPVRAVRFTFSGNTQNRWNTIDGIGFRIVPTGK